MSDENQVTVMQCGPGNTNCKCECGHGGECEHRWDGPEIVEESFGSATCSRCGIDAMSHSLWVSP